MGVDLRGCGELGLLWVYNVPGWRWRLAQQRLAGHRSWAGYKQPDQYVHWQWYPAEEPGAPGHAVGCLRQGDTYYGRWAGLLELHVMAADALGPHGVVQLEGAPGEAAVCLGGWGHCPQHGLREPGVWVWLAPVVGQGGQLCTETWELQPGGGLREGAPAVEVVLGEAMHGAGQFYRRCGCQLAGWGTLAYPGMRWHDEARAAWRAVQCVGGPRDGAEVLVDTRYPNMREARDTLNENGRYEWADSGRSQLRWTEAPLEGG